MIIEHIDTLFPGTIIDRHEFRGDLTLVIDKESFLAVVELLHHDGFQFLVDITAVDWQAREKRFEVVYHWLNLASQDRLRLKVRLAEGEAMPSLTSLFKTANWFEREVFDLFGIPFDGHPNLKRLLLWDDFQGHALRKDFPLDGGDPFCMEGCTTPYNSGQRTQD